ncbi:MAG TPA: SulP family inorganic anion transporter [Clostridia bacterium]|nr:SulP family inorganic anion transporter [Clostridia bacterium]
MRPTVVRTLKQYTLDKFIKDLISGVTVGIIALPLAIALGIASGVSPEKGLITAVIGGFLVSALGGCSVQIGGPTGAFVVIVAGAIAKHGLDGLILATAMAGALLILAGVLRFGKLLQFIPYPVVAGFTSGIAITIFSTQVGDFLGLRMGAAPAEFLHKWAAYFRAMGTASWQTILVGALALCVILLWPKVNKRVPGTLIALLLATLAAFLLPGVATIGSRFADISVSIPAPSLPAFSLAKAKELFPTALTIAFLAGVESLLSAVVADGMTGMRHDPNMELVAQGFANIGSAFFGGIPVTGALARTAANVRNGGRTPVAGMMHAVTLLAIMLVLMPFVKFVPMTALAAVLMVVAYNMGEWEYFREMKHLPKSDCAVFLTAFFLTVVLDLVAAIGAALVLAAILVLVRLKNMVNVTPQPVDEATVRLNVQGPLFFVAAHRLQEIAHQYHGMTTLLLDLKSVPFMDASALKEMTALRQRAEKSGICLKIENLQPQPLKLLAKNGFEVA